MILSGSKAFDLEQRILLRLLLLILWVAACIFLIDCFFVWLNEWLWVKYFTFFAKIKTIDWEFAFLQLRTCNQGSRDWVKDLTFVFLHILGYCESGSLLLFFSHLVEYIQVSFELNRLCRLTVYQLEFKFFNFFNVCFIKHWFHSFFHI